MAERYRSIFFTILSLTVVWFLIILLCLSQNDITEQWPIDSKQPLASSLSSSDSHSQQRVDFIQVYDENSDSLVRPIVTDSDNGRNHNSIHNHFQSPLSPEFLRNLQAKHRGISASGTLFYQFDLDPKDSLATFTISKEQHAKETLQLGSIDNPTDQYIKTEGQRLFAFNLLVSNRIGLFRPLPDTRNFKCLKPQSSPTTTMVEHKNDNHHHQQDTSNSILALNPTTNTTEINLKASIIICYYNEAPSALLRTIYSVLKQSPVRMLKEIIVVDDFSHHEHDYNKIKAFISSDLVKLVRTNKREGLIRARLFGSNLATGDVLIFLDSHVEANVGWLEPLLMAIQENRTTISCPMIDLINAETLIYSPSPMVKGGLNWALNFKWDSVPSEKLRTYDDFVKPIDSPTMAGGLYAIDRLYFKRLGEYDHGMELWGGENIELSLRAWMCGGRIVILPCSRVGHIFRKRRPYGPEPDQPDSLLINSHRAARVWLDEYIYKFYESNPDAKYLVSGDVTQRLELRQKLGCQNFTWYLDNIYPPLKKELLDSENNNLKQGGAKLLESVSNHRVTSSSGAISSSSSGSNLYVGPINNRMQRQVSLDQQQQQQHHINSLEMPSSIDLNTTISGSNNNMNEETNFPTINSNLKRNHKYKYNTNHQQLLPPMVAQFQIQSTGSNFCIESKGGFLAKSFKRLVLNHCAEVNRNSDGEILINNSTILDQLWTETELHDYRLGDNQCLDLIKNLPLLRECHSMGSFQLWSRHNKTMNTIISNPGATLCLGVERIQVGEPIIVTICERQQHQQQEQNMNENYNTQVMMMGNSFGQFGRKFKPDRLYPGWRTSSSTYIGRRLMGGVGNLKPLKPNQRWNLLFISKKSTSSPAHKNTVPLTPEEASTATNPRKVHSEDP